jgi:hypothetical protein
MCSPQMKFSVRMSGYWSTLHIAITTEALNRIYCTIVLIDTFALALRGVFCHEHSA